MPEVTVIIPTYNRSALLVRSVNSVLAQTFRDFEIIVVDDASSDDTAARFDEIADGRITMIRKERNGGIAAARNTGIRQVHGRYVAFLDDDDEWLPNKLEKQVAALKKMPDIDGITCSHYDIIGGYRRLIRVRPSDDLLYRFLTGRADLATPTLLMTKSSLDMIGGFDESLTRYEEVDLLVKFLAVYRMTSIAEPLVVIHRDYRSSLKELEKNTLILIERIKKFVPYDDYRLSNILSFQYLMLALNLMLGNGSIRSCFFYIMKSLRKRGVPYPRLYVTIFLALLHRLTGIDPMGVILRCLSSIQRINGGNGKTSKKSWNE